jgi:hypothetical protein
MHHNHTFEALKCKICHLDIFSAILYYWDPPKSMLLEPNKQHVKVAYPKPTLCTTIIHLKSPKCMLVVHSVGFLGHMSLSSTLIIGGTWVWCFVMI